MVITIQNKQYNLPLAWEEVTVEQFVRFSKIEKEDLLTVAGAFLGIDVETLKQLPVKDFDLLDYSLQWLAEPIKLSELEDYLVVNGEPYFIPKDLNQLCFGQILEIEGALKVEGNNYSPECFADVLGIFLVDIKDGYSTDKAKELAVKISQTPIVDVMPVVSFFSKALESYSKKRQSGFKANQPKAKKRQGWNGLQSLGRFLKLSYSKN